MTAPLTEAEAGAALFGWLAEAGYWKRHVGVQVDSDGGYLVMLDGPNQPERSYPAGFSGATRAEALMAAARWVMEGKGGERG